TDFVYSVTLPFASSLCTSCVFKVGQNPPFPSGNIRVVVFSCLSYPDRVVFSTSRRVTEREPFASGLETVRVTLSPVGELRVSCSITWSSTFSPFRPRPNRFSTVLVVLASTFVVCFSDCS